MKQSRAFTLIELSIALVIIGLLVGGVLVGRDLIEVAQARSVIKQMDSLQVAITTFKLKYNCIPGDCANGAALGLGANGNGDGYVGGRTTSDCLATNAGTCLTTTANLSTTFFQQAYIYGEQQRFWIHLGSASLIPSTYSVIAVDNTAVTADEMVQYFPKDALGKAYITAYSWGSRLFVHTGVSYLGTFKAASNETPVLKASQMQFIHSKYYSQIIIGATRFDSLWASQQKVIPLGAPLSVVNSRYLTSAEEANVAVFNWPACVVSDGAGGYRYNISGGGLCNLMWEFTY